MSPEEKKIYEALDLDAKSVDEIARQTGLTLLQSMRALLNLQLQDLAAEVSKNRYIRKIA